MACFRVQFFAALLLGLFPLALHAFAPPATTRGAMTMPKFSASSLMTRSSSRSVITKPPRTRTTTLSLSFVHLAETVAPKLGIVTALFLFLSPATEVREAVRSNQLCDLNPLPIALMAVVTTSWLAYGLAVADLYVALSNLPGALLSLSYLIGILPVMQIATSGTAGVSANRRELRAVQALLVAGSASSLVLWTALRFSGASLATAKTWLGLVASAFTILLFGSPLSTVRTVVQQRNAASILGRLTVAQIVNATLWTVYGITLRQVFVWVPNGVGLVLGLAQLALKCIYPSDAVCVVSYDKDDGNKNDTMEDSPTPQQDGTLEPARS